MTADAPDEPTHHRWHLGGALRQNNYGHVFGIMLMVLLVLCLFVPFKTPADKAATCIAIGVCIGLCYLPVVLGLLFRPLAATASDDGLEWRTAFGGGRRPWAEVASVYRKDILNVENARGKTTVVFKGGPTLRFGQSLTDYEELADRIQNEAAQAALGPARAALAGGELALGPLTVQTDGVAVGKTLIRWNDLAGFTLISGQFFLLGSGAELESVPPVWLYQVPNHQVLFRLLEERGVPYKPWSPSGGVLTSPPD